MDNLPPPPSPPPLAVPQGSTSGLAIASLVFGSVSLLTGAIAGIPAVICGHIARARILRSAGAMSGDGLALGGLIGGYIGIFLTFALVGLLLPAIGIAKDQARKAEARSAVVGIATAIKGYYTGYGKYPLDDPDSNAGHGDLLFGSTDALSNARLFNILRAIDSLDTTKYNPRKIVFFDGRTARDPAHPRSGFVSGTGAYVDPWGNEYRIAIDTNYDDLISNLPYADFQGANAPHVGIAVFSLGKDGQLGTQGDNTYETGGQRSDDIISWK